MAAVLSLAFFVKLAQFSSAAARVSERADARGLWAAAALTVVTYLISVAIAYRERANAGAGIPIAGAAAFGWIMLVLTAAATTL